MGMYVYEFEKGETIGSVEFRSAEEALDRATSDQELGTATPRRITLDGEVIYSHERIIEEVVNRYD
jgi:hypothetical protein